MSVAENETDYVTGEEPVTIGDETYSPSDLYLDEKAVVTLPNDAQFSDADKYLQTDQIPREAIRKAQLAVLFASSADRRRSGVAWVTAVKGSLCQNIRKMVQICRALRQ